jgi:hypothetical protein
VKDIPNRRVSEFLGPDPFEGVGKGIPTEKGAYIGTSYLSGVNQDSLR